MALLREWVLTLISILIFITFIEFLLPQSKHRRYINVIMGLVIMLAILRPLMGFIQNGQDLETQMLITGNQLEQMTLNNRMETAEIHNEEMIMQVYEENLKTQMKTRIESLMGLEVAAIYLEVETEQEGKIGTIKELEIVLSDQALPEETAAEGIQPVHVNVDLSGKSNNNTGGDSISIVSERDDIQNDFSSFYNIAKDKIRVSVQENR